MVSMPTTVSYAITLKKLPWIAVEYPALYSTRRGFLAGNMIVKAAVYQNRSALDRTDMQFGRRQVSYPTAVYHAVVTAIPGYDDAALQKPWHGDLIGPKPEDGPLIDPFFFAEPGYHRGDAAEGADARAPLVVPTSLAEYGG